MPNPVGTAEVLRAVEVERLNKQVASIQRDINTGINGINGCPAPYLIQRREWLVTEKLRLEAEVAALGSLDPEELVARFNPPPPNVEPVQLGDVFKRGETGPKPVIMNRETLPDRHLGGGAAPVQPSEAAFGRVYTYNKDGQLVPA